MPFAPTVQESPPFSKSPFIKRLLSLSSPSSLLEIVIISFSANESPPLSTDTVASPLSSIVTKNLALLP